MAHLRIRIEEMEYRPEEKALFILGVNAFQQIVTLEISPVYPRQMAADLDYVARNPGERVTLGDGGGGGGNDGIAPGVDSDDT